MPRARREIVSLPRRRAIALLAALLLAACGDASETAHPAAQPAPRPTIIAFAPLPPTATRPLPAAVLSAPTPPTVAATATAVAVPAGVARLRRADGATRDVRIEIADTDAARARGLMERRSLAGDAGMLFIFPGDTDGGFWMRNTLIPLSIAFIDAGGKIVALADMQPLSEEIHRPDRRYRYALEVNQGYFAREGIHVGDAVAFAR
ncbi:MAG: DUF192 domain-containing protein [Chloroflexi bacterium]|nr:DUF192 domain-containing protein [Chloroflexota bacterium]